MGRFTITKEDAIDFAINAAFNYFAELLGTGTLVFVGCMVNTLGLGQHKDLLGTTLAFGMAIVAGIEVASCISGGHINPMLTVVSMIFRKTSIPMGAVYILGQLTGSLLAFGLVKGLAEGNFSDYPLEGADCTTVPHPEISLVQAVFIEFLASSVLVLVVCAQWDPRNKCFETVSLKIGFTVFCLSFATAAYTGCSMNPARSLGPAVWNNTWTHHWIYWICPLLAGVIWSLIYSKIFVDLARKKETENPQD